MSRRLPNRAELAGFDPVTTPASTSTRQQHLDGEAWPAPGDRTMAAYRIPTGVLYMARAKAEAEGINLTDVVTELLGGYIAAPMGSTTVWVDAREVDRLRSAGR